MNKILEPSEVQKLKNLLADKKDAFDKVIDKGISMLD